MMRKVEKSVEAGNPRKRKHCPCHFVRAKTDNCQTATQRSNGKSNKKPGTWQKLRNSQQWDLKIQKIAEVGILCRDRPWSLRQKIVFHSSI